MSHEIYKRYRPKKLGHVVGQEEATGMLKDMVKKDRVPHALLFHGASGCGKTTCARILKDRLEVSDFDFIEINAASHNGIDDIRSIEMRMGMSPVGGSKRIWLIDEAHQLTGQAQEAFLKILEDTPSHVHFILCTTDPNKLKATIKTRCTEIKFNPVSQTILAELVQNTANAEELALTQEVCDKIAEVADGSPRKALVILDQIIGLPGPEAQLAAISKIDTNRQAIELCRVLLNPGSGWADVQAILKTIEEEPERLRHSILAYATSVLLGNKTQLHKKAHLMILCFEKNFYDSKRAGLVASCWDVLGGK